MKTNYDLRPYFNRCSVGWYQTGRIYLDEYPEQKKLREEYFWPEANFYNRFIKRN